MKRLALAFAVLALAETARAQVTFEETPSFVFTGRALLSYGGTWTPLEHGILLQRHLLTEGFGADLAGWLYDSRYVKFRSFALVLHLDQLGPHRSGPYSFGFGTSFRLFSRSILPITLSAVRGLTIPGSTAEPVASATTTTLYGDAQLVSALLPKAELQVQHVISEAPPQQSFVTDQVSGEVHGESTLHRYSGIVTWSGQRADDQPAVKTVLASIADELYPTGDTTAHLQAGVAQGRGLGGAAADGFTGYQTSAALTSRLRPGTVLRTAYSFSGAGASDRDEVDHQISAGATIDLRPVPLLLGEGVAATYSTINSPGLQRTLATVSAAQGFATSGRAGAVQYGFSLTGQAGYSEVSDGRSGTLFGFGTSANVQAPVFRVPVRGAVSYQLRDDASSAAQSSRTLNANVIGTFVRGPLLLLPTALYSRIVRIDPTIPGGWLESSAASVLLSGAAPVWRTYATFAAGWTEGWSNQPDTTATGSVFGHGSTAFSLGPGRFGNVAADVTHTLDGGTATSLLASAVWTFRESTISVNYVYNRAFPAPGGTHSFSVLFTRSMRAFFLPEHR